MTLRSQKVQIKQLHMLYVLLAAISLGYIYIVYRNAKLFHSPSTSFIKLFIISASVALPEILIWTISFVSSIRVKEYAILIARSREAKGFNYLADSLILLSFYVILFTTGGDVVGLFKGSSSINTIVSVENYIPLFFALASSGLLLAAAIEFNHLVKLSLRRSITYYGPILFIIICGLFTWHFEVIEPSLREKENIPRFALSDLLLVLTYIIPYILAWGVGLFACYSISNYSHKVRGTIYKSLFSNLSKGVSLVFICTFLAQLLILSKVTLNTVSFGLVLIYCVLVLAVIGFRLIFKGASRLTKVEKV